MVTPYRILLTDSKVIFLVFLVAVSQESFNKIIMSCRNMVNERKFEKKNINIEDQNPQYITSSNHCQMRRKLT